MKRLIRLLVIGILAVTGAAVYARNSVAESLLALGFGKSLDADQGVPRSDPGYSSILFTDWLAGDVLSLSSLPIWKRSESGTAETMRAYAELHEARQDSEALTEEHRRSVKHFEAKDQVFQQLLDQKIHLVVAARCWFELDNSYDRTKPEIISTIYPGKTPTERYCRRLIRELELTSGREPRRTRAALHRARAELQFLTQPGMILTTL
jgi:hypothetical protein